MLDLGNRFFGTDSVVSNGTVPAFNIISRGDLL